MEEGVSKGISSQLSISNALDPFLIDLFFSQILFEKKDLNIRLSNNFLGVI